MPQACSFHPSSSSSNRGTAFPLSRTPSPGRLGPAPPAPPAPPARNIEPPHRPQPRTRNSYSSTHHPARDTSKASPTGPPDVWRLGRDGLSWPLGNSCGHGGPRLACPRVGARNSSDTAPCPRAGAQRDPAVAPPPTCLSRARRSVSSAPLRPLAYADATKLSPAAQGRTRGKPAPRRERDAP